MVGKRTIAVDWAVSKAQFQSSGAAAEPEPQADADVAHEGDSDEDEGDSLIGEDDLADELEEAEPTEAQLQDEKKLLRSVLSQIDADSDAGNDEEEDEEQCHSEPQSRVCLPPLSACYRSTAFIYTTILLHCCGIVYSDSHG